MSCEEKNEPIRCLECPHVGFNRKRAYYPNWYCKVNGQDINFCERYGWDRMVWCPIVKEEKHESSHQT